MYPNGNLSRYWERYLHQQSMFIKINWGKMGQFSHRLKNVLLSWSPVTFEGTLKCFFKFGNRISFPQRISGRDVAWICNLKGSCILLFFHLYSTIIPSIHAFPGNQHCDVGKRLHHALQTIMHILLLFKSAPFSYICSYCLKISHSFSCHVTAHSSQNL